MERRREMEGAEGVGGERTLPHAQEMAYFAADAPACRSFPSSRSVCPILLKCPFRGRTCSSIGYECGGSQAKELGEGKGDKKRHL